MDKYSDNVTLTDAIIRYGVILVIIIAGSVILSCLRSL